MPWHPLDEDDGNPEPDWGQYHEGPRPTPDTVVTMRVMQPQPAAPTPKPRPKPRPKPKPKPRPAQTRAGEGALLDELYPPATGLWRPPGESRRATMRFHAPPRRRARSTPDKDQSDPVVDTPGGLIRRSRSPMGNHRGDLDAIELRAYEQEPRFVRMMRRRHFAHWRS
jgi:outer membrane biosynthesis protein TonB